MASKKLTTTWPSGALLGGLVASVLVASLLQALDGLADFRNGFVAVLWAIYLLRWGIAVYRCERSRAWIFYIAMIIVGPLGFEALLDLMP